MDILIPEFKSFLLLLNKHKVHFILIGGYAVIYYGYERNTSDMDLWLEPSNENREKFIDALKEYGISNESLGEIMKLNFTDTLFFYLGQKPKRIDFLTKISGVSFREAFDKAKMLPLKNEFVPIINYHHLILSKISNDRMKDKADVEELQRINKNKNRK